MQVGINTFSFSYLKFNFEVDGQKLKSIEKRFQIALISGYFSNYENQSDKPIFWHLARRMCRDILLLYSNLYWKRFSCRIDYLKITNGTKEARYCGEQFTGRDLLVSGNYVVFTFHTDWLLENKKGFEIIFAPEKGNNFTFRAIYTRKNKTRPT